MRSTSSFRLLAAALAATAISTQSCTDAPSAVPQDAHALAHLGATDAKSGNAGGNSGLLKTVHAATSRFHATVQATKAGYAVASPCVSSPAGGMGFHWVNQSLVDPVFDPMQPEAVLYAPDENGKLKLVAVEYIVVDVGQPRPAFDGHPFDIGGTPVPVAHWSQHVWLHQDNPSGVFAPFNPDVACPASSAPTD